MLPHLAIAKAQIRSGRRADGIATLRKTLRERNVLHVYEWMTAEQWLLALLRAEGRADEVEDMLRDAVTFREQFLTAQHAATLEANVKLASWLVDRDRPQDAETLLDGCRELASHSEATSGRKRFAMETAMRIHQALNQPERAARWQTRLTEFDATTKDEVTP